MAVVRESDEAAYILPAELAGWLKLLLDLWTIHHLFPCDA